MTADSTTAVLDAPGSPTLEVRHDPDHDRYTLWLDGDNIGLTDYHATDAEITFTHTEVDPTLREHGLASILIEQALDDVRTRTALTVIAQCPYVAHWIDTHAEYHDLLTRGI